MDDRAANEHQSQPVRKLSDALTLVGWCILLFPLSVIAHEMGHWLTALLAGFPATLHFASVSGFPELPPFGGKPVAVALVSLAGPVVTIALVGLGMANFDHSWGRPLVAVSALRFVVNLIFFVQIFFVMAGIAAPSEANFDEVTAARALGLPSVPIVGVGMLALMIALVRLWRASRITELGMIVLGVALGAGLWLGVIGPAILP